MGSLNCLISESETLEFGQPNRSTAQFDNESDSTNLTCQSAQFNVSKLKGLNIASLNMNSIMRHIDEIRVLLFDCSFDILAINVTKLDDTIFDCEIHINNYSIVCYDRNRYGGGVAIYVKNSILYNTLLNFPDLIGYLRSLFIICILYTVRKDLDNLEMICVEITKQHSNLSSSHIGIDLLTLSKPSFLILRCFFLRASDLENKKSIIMGDLDCDVSKLTPDTHTC